MSILLGLADSGMISISSSGWIPHSILIHQLGGLKLKQIHKRWLKSVKSVRRHIEV